MDEGMLLAAVNVKISETKQEYPAEVFGLCPGHRLYQASG